MDEIVRRKVLVSGQVQGVFFRESARQRASELEITGFARNLADGRVELELEGSLRAIEAMLSWCAVGSRRALVSSIEVFEAQPLGSTGFSIS